MIKGVVLDLFNKYNGVELRYGNLPQCAKNSVDIYYTDELGIKVSDDDIFGYVEIPIDDLKAAIIKGDYNEEHWVDFDEYHRDYMLGGDVPPHQEIWAVLLSNDDREVIFDGCHRFHSYVDRGILTIPCVNVVHIKDMMDNNHQ